MDNDLKNSSGLDGAIQWNGGVVTVDEAVLGSPGRAVIRSTAAYMQSAVNPVAAGQKVHAFSHHLPGSDVYIQFFTAGDVNLAPALLPRLQNPSGSARRGLPGTFAFSKGSVTAPATAAKYALSVTAAGGPVAVLKPYASRTRNACRWTPGPHSNPDLILPVWPESLPHILDLETPRTKTRAEFSTDSDIPVTIRTGNTPRTMFSGTMRLDLEQRDVLEQFFLEQSEPFLFVNPASDELCRAWWMADGEPSDQGRGPDRRTSIGLILEVL